jgi:hypothetical protein
MRPQLRRVNDQRALLMYDDYSHLQQALRAVFAYLVSGGHDRGFLEVVSKRR